MRGLRLGAGHWPAVSFQMSWSATNVLPVPVGQRQQCALATCENGLERALDRDALVVPGLLDGAVRISKLASEGAENELRRTVVADALPGSEAGPRLRRRGKRRKFSLGASVEVVLNDAFAVCRVGEREVEQLRVPHRLLKTVGRKPVLALGLHDGDRETRSALEQVVSAKRIATPVFSACDDDAAMADRILLDDLIRGPAGVLQSRDDVVPAGLFLERAESGHRR